MRDLLGKARSRVGVAVISAGLLAVGGTATAAVIAVSPAAEVSEVTPASTSDVPAVPDAVPAEETPAPVAAVTTDAPAPAEVPAPSEPTATVGAVTEPAPAAEAEVVDPESIGSRGTDGHYTPAPPRQNPGEPPALPEPPAPEADSGAPSLPDQVR